MMALPICSQCGRAVQPADAAFCPYCGSVMTAQTQNVPEGAKAYLRKADDLRDPVKKHELLLKAEREYPDCLEVAEALLFLGRLYERNPRELDYSVIKCFLWHMYLTPGEFPEEKKQQMREELFRHPQLVRCMQLAPDANAFLRRYLKRLGCGFVALFLKGSNHYTRTWFGFRIDNRMSRVLAQPELEANCVDASLVHEAAIGKIAGEQLIKLMTLGLSEQEAEEQIINGFLR